MRRSLLAIGTLACVVGCAPAFYDGIPPGAPKSATFADVDGARIRFVDEGEGPPVVLVHGFASALETWLGVMRAQQEPPRARGGPQGLRLVEPSRGGLLAPGRGEARARPHDPARHPERRGRRALLGLVGRAGDGARGARARDASRALRRVGLRGRALDDLHVGARGGRGRGPLRALLHRAPGREDGAGLLRPGQVPDRAVRRGGADGHVRGRAPPRRRSRRLAARGTRRSRRPTAR